LNKPTRRENIKNGQVWWIGSPYLILPNADDAFLEHFINDYKPIFNDEALKLKNMIKSGTFFMDRIKNIHPWSQFYDFFSHKLVYYNSNLLVVLKNVCSFRYFSYDFLVGYRITWKTIFFFKTRKRSNKKTKILTTWKNRWKS
jgi:hypothetical protein